MVCQSLLVEATALQCAHTFCASCIATWLARAAHCPACRAPVGVLEAPVRLRSVDAVARGLAAALPPAERDAWHAREQEAARRRAECEAAAERLRASIAAERARAGAAAFLRVGAEAWTREEADNFREGAGVLRRRGARRVLRERRTDARARGGGGPGAARDGGAEPRPPAW